MTEIEIVENLKDYSLNKSQNFNGGERNYAFAYGYFTGDMVSLLCALNLTKKQQKVAEEFVNRVTNR